MTISAVPTVPTSPPSLGQFVAWGPSPLPLLPAAAVVAGLWYLWARWRVTTKTRRWPAYKTACFLAGCVVLFATTTLGIERYSYGLFGAFMFQHLTLSMAVPPLLVLGSPGTLMLRSTPHTGIGYHINRYALVALRSRWSAALLHPLVGIPLFLASYYGIYLSPIVSSLAGNTLGHTAMEVFFVISGLLFILPVLATGPVPGRHSNFGRLFHLFVEMPLHVFFGVIFMVASVPLVPYFADSAARWGVDPIVDQQWAGGLAWAYGEPVGLLIVLVFAVRWRRDESRTYSPEKTDAELADYNDFLRDLSGATAPRMPQPTRSDHAPVSTTPVTQSPHPPR
ncbi:cytochrome c oxidase assembly protein [Gordonia aquimaris]|uniref:cytochrome c oxidase assembly protein n=1 Tax=Gordonia aquimaris TaxID=2984863 RepID=UPI0026D54F2F|nr:cytochrome c oxidase assembly protein [Gordonia aquimaris]